MGKMYSQRKIVTKNYEWTKYCAKFEKSKLANRQKVYRKRRIFWSRNIFQNFGTFVGGHVGEWSPAVTVTVCWVVLRWDIIIIILHQFSTIQLFTILGFAKNSRVRLEIRRAIFNRLVSRIGARFGDFCFLRCRFFSRRSQNQLMLSLELVVRSWLE